MRKGQIFWRWSGADFPRQRVTALTPFGGVHRQFGALQQCDQIVMVAVSSARRDEAFAACEFIMDWLKTGAPFWKKEETVDGSRWVDAKAADDDAAARWK